MEDAQYGGQGYASVRGRTDTHRSPPREALAAIAAAVREQFTDMSRADRLRLAHHIHLLLSHMDEGKVHRLIDPGRDCSRPATRAISDADMPAESWR